MYFIGDEEIEALKKLFARKKLYRYQSAYVSECDLFEKEFSEYAVIPHALLLSSGTNALVLSLLAAGIQAGDEVLIPTYTFVATAAAVVQAGAIPVMVNIDKNLSMDMTDAQKKISPKTKALILVHMDGLVANVIDAETFCAEHSLIFIEDVAQAIGASCGEKKLGTFGAFGCFSLNENKNISCGEGGILVTKQRQAYEKAFCFHDGPAQFNPNKKEFFTEVSPFMGLSMRVSEIQGAIMRVQLTRLEFILSELRKRKSVLLESLQGISEIDCITGYSIGECASSLHLQFIDPEKGARFGKALREAGFMFIPVTSRPAHASWKWSHLLDKTYPVSDYLQSVDILMRTLKMEIDIHLSIEDTQNSALKLRRILTSLS